MDRLIEKSAVRVTWWLTDSDGMDTRASVGGGWYRYGHIVVLPLECAHTCELIFDCGRDRMNLRRRGVVLKAR